MTGISGFVRERVDWLLGSPSFRGVSYNLARLGLHGLGVAVSPEPDKSGERHFLRTFMRECGSSLALDVGANIGDYTEMLLELGASRVVAFEPVPASAMALTGRFAADPRVTIRAEAVGETAGSVVLNVPSDSATSVLASRGGGAARFTAAPTAAIEVPMVTLDAIVESLDTAPDFLKIDVEGFEPEVLAGASALLASGSLKAVQIEFSYHDLLRGTTLLTFVNQLPGYELYRIASRSLRRLDAHHYLGTIYGFSNIVALRSDVAEKLRRMM